MLKTPKWLFNRRKEQGARRGEPRLAATPEYDVIRNPTSWTLRDAVTQVFLDFDILKHVEAGDFVMSIAQAVGVFRIHRLRQLGRVTEPSPAHICAVLRVPIQKRAIYRGAPSDVEPCSRRPRPSFGFDNFTMVILPVVPLEEQRAIADLWIVSSPSPIKGLQSRSPRSRNTRPAWIDAAVTGKIKVA